MVFLTAPSAVEPGSGSPRASDSKPSVNIPGTAFPFPFSAGSATPHVKSIPHHL